jgi:1-acyl-sn-glycerol-3-phosphate acyltransferase
MLFLRSSLYFLGTMVAISFIASITIILFFLPFSYRYYIASRWAYFCIWWLRITANIELKVIGKENIPDDPCVIISNHQSTLETLAFQTIFPPQTWVFKRELLWLPLFGWAIALLKPVVINRGKKIAAMKKVITGGSDRLKNGIFVVVFPEGTRQPYGKLGDYQNGGSAIAKKSNNKLIPVFHDSGKCWPKGSFVKKPGTINIVIGKPIDPNSKSATQISNEIKEWTQNQSNKFSI